MLLSKLLDVPVLSLEGGEVVSVVKGWLLRCGEPAALCLLTEPLRWYEKVGCLLFENIIGMHENAVTVRGRDAAGSLSACPGAPEDARDCLTGVGADVFTPAGELLGMISDICVDGGGGIRYLLLHNGEKIPARRLLTCGKAFIAGREEGEPVLFESENIKIGSSISNTIEIRRILP